MLKTRFVRMQTYEEKTNCLKRFGCLYHFIIWLLYHYFCSLQLKLGSVLIHCNKQQYTMRIIQVYIQRTLLPVYYTYHSDGLFMFRPKLVRRCTSFCSTYLNQHFSWCCSPEWTLYPQFNEVDIPKFNNLQWKIICMKMLPLHYTTILWCSI